MLVNQKEKNIMKKINFVVLLITILMAMTMLFTSCDESNPSTENNGTPSSESTQCEHNYTSKVTTEATCTKDGVKTFTCSVCKDSYTEAIAATGKHNYTSKVTTEATCTKDGVKTFTCSVCKDSYTEAIAATGKHNYTSKVTTEATCTKDGVKMFTCSVCNNSYTEAIIAIGHTVNTNNVCTVCNQQALQMTNQEIENANKITNILINFTTDFTNGTTIWIRLCDENNNQYIAPFIVEIKIINENGKTVYNEIKTIKSEDFKKYSTYYYGPLAEISISKEDIIKDNVDTGTIYLKVYNPGYFMTGENGERKGPITGLADKLELPTLPVTIVNSNAWVKITNVTYEVSGDDLYIYFTGEKTYDSKGSSYSRSCKIGWKLYDSEGYLVDSGIAYTDALKVGEKFKNKKEYCWDVIEPGMTYRLELVSVDG